MLPALTAHLKAISLGLSVLLQTALARLLPCLWSAAPPDKLFHLPPPCHYERPTAVVPLLALLLLLLLFKAAMVCLSHFTLQFDSALWSLPYSGLAPAAQTLWIPQARRRPGRFFFFGWVLFSQLWQSDACYRPPPWWPWKIRWLIWGSDGSHTVHEQKFNTRLYECALSNIKIVWTLFRKRIITMKGNYRCRRDNCLFTGFIGVIKGLPEQSCCASFI